MPGRARGLGPTTTSQRLTTIEPIGRSPSSQRHLRLVVLPRHADLWRLAPAGVLPSPPGRHGRRRRSMSAVSRSSSVKMRALRGLGVGLEGVPFLPARRPRPRDELGGEPLRLQRCAVRRRTEAHRARRGLRVVFGANGEWSGERASLFEARHVDAGRGMRYVRGSTPAAMRPMRLDSRVRGHFATSFPPVERLVRCAWPRPWPAANCCDPSALAASTRTGHNLSTSRWCSGLRPPFWRRCRAGPDAASSRSALDVY